MRRRRRSRKRPGGRRWWAWVRLVLLGGTLAGVTGIVMALPILPTGQVVLDVGDIAVQDVRAPRSLTYESAVLGAEERARAADDVAPVYTSPDPMLWRQQLDRARQILDYLGSVRADEIASRAQKTTWVLAVPELADLTPESATVLLDLSGEGWDRVQLETLSVVDQAMRRQIRDEYLDNAWDEVHALASLDLSAEETFVAVALGQRLLVANSFLDVEATEEARERAAEDVGPVVRTFQVDEIVVREGDRVTALHVEALEQFGLRQTKVRWADVLGAGALAALGTSLLFFYLARFQPEVVWEGQPILLLVLLTLAFVLGVGLMVPGSTVLRYLSPVPALGMLAAAALGPHAGVATAVFLGGVSGMVANSSIEMAIYAVSGGLVAALVVGRVERISALFRAGGLVAVVHVVILATLRIPQDAPQLGNLLVATLAGIANGGVSASLAVGGLFLVGPLFDIPTTIRLIELSRPDYPLLRRLLREAPATYHHSLMVANLAEQAAERIGADPLLTRVGAYYHDVGKIARPYFFAENQAEGVNPHDRLDPRTSVEVIVSHVKDGIDLARRYRLPSRVRDFIPEHHGTNRVSYLYSRAVQQAGDAALVDEEDFRHIGPKPQSRETALVMLADGCEAAVRALRPASEEEVTEIVNRVFSDRVADGQLNECDLSLRDLEGARVVFISALKGVFHPRVKYPPQESTEAGDISAQGKTDASV